MKSEDCRHYHTDGWCASEERESPYCIGAEDCEVAACTKLDTAMTDDEVKED